MDNGLTTGKDLAIIDYLTQQIWELCQYEGQQTPEITQSHMLAVLISLSVEICHQTSKACGGAPPDVHAYEYAAKGILVRLGYTFRDEK